MQKAKEWYSKVFGIQPYFDEPFYVGFEIEGFELGLHISENNTSNTSKGVVSYWAVDDVEAEYRRLIELGAEEHEKPVNVGGELIVASVLDPFGNPIGIIYNPYFKYKGSQ